MLITKHTFTAKKNIYLFEFNVSIMMSNKIVLSGNNFSCCTGAFVQLYCCKLQNYSYNGDTLYSAKLINKIIRRAEKSSITQAAREFGVAYNTINQWLIKRQAANKENGSQVQTVPENDIAKRVRPENQISHRRIRQKEFEQFAAESHTVISIQYKLIKTIFPDSPAYLLTAYDLNSGFFNFCYTREKNKSNKALYLLYLHDFFKSNGTADLLFITELKFAQIRTIQHQGFYRMIEGRVNKLVMELTKFIADSTDLSEMLLKSLVFLADRNLNLGKENLIHSPFVLEDNVSGFDFKNNSIMVNSVSRNANQSILNHKECLKKMQLNNYGISPEKLLRIYNFLNSRKIESRQLENKLLQDVGTMQLMGDLSKSEQFLELLLSHKSLSATGRNRLYLFCGLQKFRKGEYAAACKFYHKGISGSRKTDDLLTEFEGSVNFCSLYLHQGLPDRANQYLRIIKRLANRLNQDICYARSCFISGYYHFVRGDFSTAAAEYQQSAYYADKAGSPHDYTNAIAETANSFIDLKKYKKALRFAKIALKRNLVSGLKIPLAISYFYCATCYFYLNEYDLSREMVLKQLEVLAGLNYLIIEYLGRELYVRLLLATGNLEQAHTEFAVLEVMITRIDNHSFSESFNELAKEIHR